VWGAIFADRTEISGFNYLDMMTYLTITTTMAALFSSYMEIEIEENVRLGTISIMMTKPFSYPFYLFAREFGKLLFYIFMRALPLILLVKIFLNIKLAFVSLFCVSLLFGWIIEFCMNFLIGMWSFWTKGEIWGMRFVKRTVSTMISGSLIPLFLFPKWLLGIVQLLPFQAVFYIPVSIYMGMLSGSELLNAILTQLVWVLFFGVVCWLVWNKAKKKMFVYGG
jgi:ABC-2 type transport system permease protein